MARPYSVDLRERVLQAHEASEGRQRVLAERFAVSVGTVCGWLGLARCEGRRMPGDGARWVGRIRRS
jgi:transposase